MASRGNHNWGVDGVGIHAGLVVVMHRYQGPVCDYACDADGMGISGRRSRTRNEVFDGGGIEEFDVWESEDFGEDRGCEEGLAHMLLA